MNKQKGAANVAVVIEVIVAVVVVVGLIYWYANYSGSMSAGTEASTTPEGSSPNGSTNASSGASSVVTKLSGAKEYSNFTYGYAVAFSPDTKANVATPADVSFGIASGASTTPDGTLRIRVAIDVTHVGYCLTVPAGATAVATTSVNGVGFLSYKVGATSAANTGTTYYRLLHKGPAGNACYDIQKTPQSSATLSQKLNTILQSLTFIKSA